LKIFTSLFIILIINILASAQTIPTNSNCSDAFVLCYDSVYTTNVDTFTVDCSTNTDVGDCQSQGSWGQCYDVKSSLWFKFLTNNSGGDASLSINNISFRDTFGFLDIAVILMGSVCDISTYNTAYCDTSLQSNISIALNNLIPNSYYYIHVNTRTLNDSAQYGNFDISVNGNAVRKEFFASTDEVICMQSFGSISIDSLNFNNSPIRYKLNNNSFQSNSSFQNISYGNQQITVKDKDDCLFQSDVFVDADMSTFSVIAGEGSKILFGGTTEITAEHTGISFFWTPTNGLNKPNETTSKASPNSTTVYIANSKTNENCILKDSLTVEVLPPLSFVNTFSPNSDGINDRWVIIGIEKYPQAEVLIYSSWGQKIFEATNYTSLTAWDGEFNGKPSPVGTYYYILNLNVNVGEEKDRILKGFINLIR
jgi:gliding motility-associated-like protein